MIKRTSPGAHPDRGMSNVGALIEEQPNIQRDGGTSTYNLRWTEATWSTFIPQLINIFWWLYIQIQSHPIIVLVLLILLTLLKVYSVVSHLCSFSQVVSSTHSDVARRQYHKYYRYLDMNIKAKTNMCSQHPSSQKITFSIAEYSSETSH